MMNLFRNAEAQYQRLRGQWSAGSITRQQYEAALQQLMVQDAQGRYWMLGVDDGRWYVHTGVSWAVADPYLAAPPPPPAPAWMPPASLGTAAPLGQVPAAPAPSGRRGCSCWTVGCLALAMIVVLLLLLAGVGAALVAGVPQRMGVFGPGPEGVLGATPDREAAAFLMDELKRAGVETRGTEVYVLPFKDKPGSAAYVVLDSSQGFRFKSSSRDPIIDYFRQLAASEAVKRYDIQRIAVDYRGSTGTSLVNLTAPTATITAYANGKISRSEFLEQLDGRVDWPAFYQEMLQ